MLELILVFEVNVRPDDFTKIFSNSIALHLWDKFALYGHSVILLYSYLDKDNQAKLERYFRLKLNVMELRGPIEGAIE